MYCDKRRKLEVERNIDKLITNPAADNFTVYQQFSELANSCSEDTDGC